MVKFRFLLVFLLLSCEGDVDTFSVRVTEYPENKIAALSITFDDGCPSVFTKIVPLLDQYNLKGTFLIIARAASARNEWDKWNALIANGHEVGNHSMTHSYYLGTVQDNALLNREIDSSYLVLTSHLSKPPFSFGHPFHSTSPQADNIVFRHHYATKISPPGFCHMIPLFDNRSFKEELKEGIDGHKWIVTTAHGIGDCFAPMSYEVWQDFIQTVVASQNDVYIDTFGNLSKYKIERENTRVRITGRADNFTVSLDNDLPEVFDAPLTLAIGDLSTDHHEIIPLRGKIWSTHADEDNTYVTVDPKGSFSVKRK
ncbi:MAG TPA: polysaccharide deacetylase family protein [Chryseolinea sp.]